MANAMPPKDSNGDALPPSVPNATSIDKHPRSRCHAGFPPPPAMQSKKQPGDTSPVTSSMNTQSKKKSHSSTGECSGIWWSMKTPLCAKKHVPKQH